MKVIDPGTGKSRPAGDDCVILTFTAWTRDGALFSTSGLHGEPSTQCLATAITGVGEALKTMVEGEERRLWLPADIAFAAHVAHHPGKMVHGSPPMLDLTIEVKLIRILRAPKAPANLTAPRTARKTPSGLTIEILQPGTGVKHPTVDSRVTLNYSGWTADGKLFESTVMSGHPASFQLGTTLPGWRESLQTMVVGEKARLWIPAALAYGAHPIERSVPAGDLVYDIELIDFQ